MDKAYFPYGGKSIEFLLKRTLYLCYYLNSRVDKIVLACNTLSLIALPFLKHFFNNISGVFSYFIPYINEDSAIVGSRRTINFLKQKYPNNTLIDGTALINKLENNNDYSFEVKEINKKISNCNNLILACTHFLKLDDNLFIIKDIKNNCIEQNE